MGKPGRPWPTLSSHLCYWASFGSPHVVDMLNCCALGLMESMVMLSVVMVVMLMMIVMICF